MRILIFISSMGDGGAERVIANLANNWTTKGWDIFLVSIASFDQDCYQVHPSVKRIALGLDSAIGNIST